MFQCRTTQLLQQTFVLTNDTHVNICIQKYSPEIYQIEFKETEISD